MYLKLSTMISLLDYAVLDGKLLHQILLDVLHGPLDTLLEDVVGGPQLVVENRWGKTLDDFLLPWTMDKPFVDDTFVFLCILFISSISDKVFILVI